MQFWFQIHLVGGVNLPISQPKTYVVTTNRQKHLDDTSKQQKNHNYIC